MGADEVFGVYEGFNAYNAFHKLCCKAKNECDWSRIWQCELKSVIKTFDSYNKKTVKEAEKLREQYLDSLHKDEVYAIAFKLGYKQVKMKKEVIRKAERRIKQYKVVEIIEPDVLYKDYYVEGYRNALKKAEELIQNMNLDYLIDSKIYVDSLKEGGYFVKFYPEVKNKRKMPQKLPKNAKVGKYYKFWYFGWVRV